MMDKSDNYMDMQVVSIWIYCMDIHVYLKWRSYIIHIDIHPWISMDIFGYI
jgi:hypothetical protein